MASSTGSSDAAANGSNTLIIHFKDWFRNRHGELLDSETLKLIYTSEHRWSNPTFTLCRADQQQDAGSETSDTIATGSRGFCSLTYSFAVAGREVELAPRRKLFGGNVIYRSPAYGDQQLSWESEGRCLSIVYVCMDENGEAIARVKLGGNKLGGGRLRGKVEFVEGKAETAIQREEVAAGGLCLAYRAVMSRRILAGVMGSVPGGMVPLYS